MYPTGIGMLPAGFAPLIIVLIIWTIFWKGLALWHSARRGDTVWFVVMLMLNSLGILEIIYLFAIAKRKPANLFSK
jgi:hypothetical protein